MNNIFNIDKLIQELHKIRNESKENIEVYIKDTYSTGDYLRITDIRIDEDGDLILEINEVHNI